MQNIKLRAGMDLLNKKSGSLYEIASVKEDGSAVAKEFSLDPATMEKVFSGKECNVVPGMNDIAFRFLDDPEPYGTPEGYTVEDGILMKDGKPVTDQGSLVIKKVVGYTPANVIIEMAPRSGREDMCDLFAYNPDLDHFEKIMHEEIPHVTAIGHHGDQLLLAFSQTHTEEVKEGDDIAKVEFFDGAAVIIVTTTTNPSSRKIARAHAESIPFPVKVETARLVPLVGNDCVIMFATDKDIDERPFDEDDEDYDDAPVVSQLDSTILRETHAVINDRLFKSYADFPNPEGRFHFAPAPVLKCLVYNDGKMLIAGDDTLKTPLAAEVEDLTLVDITDNGEEIVWSFADDEMNVKKLVATKTADRGLVVKLQ